MKIDSQFYRKITFLSYIGLILLFLYWIFFQVENSQTSTQMLLLIAIGPLLLPLYGLIKGRTYTHAWCSFLSLAYFIHAVVEAWSNDYSRHLALLETVLSLGLFIGCIYYVKMIARESKNE